MRGTDRLQKLLYLIMVVLGIYILYKGSGLILKQGEKQGAFDSGNVQRELEDAAMRTYVPGYTAAVEDRKTGSWISRWMEQVVPVYSYLAEEEETGEATESVAESADATKGEEAQGQLVQAESADSEKASGKSSEGEADSGISESQRTDGDSGMSESGEMAEGTVTSEPRKSDEGSGMSESGEMTEGTVTSEPKRTDEGPGMSESGEMTEGTGISETQISDDGSGQAAEETEDQDSIQAAASVVPDVMREQLRDFDYLLANYYTVDSGTAADEQLLDADTLLEEDLRIGQDPDVPQILIYHTHSQEAFADSEEGKTEDTIIGMGDVLAGELEKYGYNVLHDTGVYDLVDGVLDRSVAYDYARESVQQILEEYPTIEVIIDLHRDGVEGQKFVTEIDGKPTSMIMFFNGISRNSNNESLYWLENPYIEENLAFSLQLQLKAREQYPGFTRNIYLKAERFNLHLRPRSLLIEAGTQLNTVEEERNAMVPLADLLHQVLSGT